MVTVVLLEESLKIRFPPSWPTYPRLMSGKPEQIRRHTHRPDPLAEPS